jgi:hypothetical protein
MSYDTDMETTTKTHEVQTDERIAEAYSEFLIAAHSAPKGTDPKTLPEWDAFLAADTDYTGWSRYYAVPGGHIHSDMACSTCNRYNDRTGYCTYTTFAWITDLSGLTADNAIAAYGPTLCTVCFPNAPVETTGKVKIADPVRAAINASNERWIAEAQAEYEAAITPELDALIVAMVEADAAQDAAPGPYGERPVDAAARAAYRALSAEMPNNFNYPQRARELGVR